jgi:hypothetical protein
VLQTISKFRREREREREREKERERERERKRKKESVKPSKMSPNAKEVASI